MRHTQLFLLAMMVLLAVGPAGMPGGTASAQSAERDFTPRQEAELRYVNRLLQRAAQRTAAGQWNGAKRDYREAIKSLTVAYETDVHPRIAELYVQLARTSFTRATAKRRGAPGRLSNAREEFAAAIATYQALEAPPSDKLLDAYVYYGDVLTCAAMPEEALAMYLKAWDLLIAEASPAVAADYFSRHRRLYSPRLKGDRNAEDQTVWFSFTIGADGLVHDIEVRESSAGTEVVADVREFLEDSRFRPRIVAREPQPVAGYTRLRFPADGGPPQEVAK